jgi:hypothetical protein
MEIKDLKLDFLWLKNPYMILGKKDPFWETWQPERWKFSEFVETAPIEKVLELIILVYKDKYPRAYWTGNFITLKGSDNVQESEGYFVFTEEYLERNEMSKYKVKLKQDAGSIDYLSEMIIELKEPFDDMISMVENTLNGKGYTKTTQNGNTLYELSNSPLLKLEVSPTLFALTVNDKFHEDLGFG